MDIKSLIQKSAATKPPRIILYSVPGAGKSTLAASMPKPIFIDVEDGLCGLDVDKFPLAESYDKVLEYMRLLYSEQHEYKTLVIDTTSELERMIYSALCKEHNKLNVEDWGYGRGYTLALQYWDRLIKGLDALREKGMAICIVAHGEVKTVSSPSFEPFDRWLPKLHKGAMAMLTEWADAVWFIDHRVTVTTSADGRRSKGIGAGQRVMYTEERPAFLAKSRISVPFEIDIPKENGWTAIVEAMK